VMVWPVILGCDRRLGSGRHMSSQYTAPTRPIVRQHQGLEPKTREHPTHPAAAAAHGPSPRRRPNGSSRGLPSVNRRQAAAAAHEKVMRRFSPCIKMPEHHASGAAPAALHVGCLIYPRLGLSGLHRGLVSGAAAAAIVGVTLLRRRVQCEMPCLSVCVWSFAR